MSSERLARFRPLVVSALERAGTSLSEMAGIQIEVTSSSLDLVPLAQVPSSAGSAEAVAVGIYVAMTGQGQGHVLLLMDEPVAQQLAGALLFEEPSGVCITDELPASALAEAGNVSCSAFMNLLGDATGILLEVTPPAVVQDMRGAIVDAIVADVALLGDEALVIGTRFNLISEGESQALDVRFLVIPSPETLEQLLTRANALAVAASERGLKPDDMVVSRLPRSEAKSVTEVRPTATRDAEGLVGRTSR
ncbi:MAG: chemotaxis protein CheX [Chloroflexi bacterium]|nr:chemotaxis protein CheX [Chloroflexota bacterium]